MKRIVVCTDGTWNKPRKKTGGIPIPTNVEKIYRSIFCDGGITQIKYYESGVGTKGIFDQLAGGITGKGLDEKIKKAYRFIVQHYRPGDEIYLFGFSRGAYTARSLAGLIRNAGIVIHENSVEAAFDLYRDKGGASHPNGGNALYFRRMLSHRIEGSRDENIELTEGGNDGAVGQKGNRPNQSKALFDDHVVRIKFIGVWDTVGALGIPMSLNPFRWGLQEYNFHDITLTSTADHAYHAIATDEKRIMFPPSIWEKSENIKYGSNKYVQQMWFPGVHSNIGGGYTDVGLSNIALSWIVNKAYSVGLRYCDLAGLELNHVPQIFNDPSAELHNSKTLLYIIFNPFRNYLREITLKDGVKLKKGPKYTINPDYNVSFHEHIHISVRQRNIISHCNYEPENVRKCLDQINTQKEIDKVFVF